MWEQIRSNERKTMILIALMAGLLMALGYALAELLEPGAGPYGVVVAFGVWLIQLGISYFAGDAIFLAMSGAREIGPDDHRVLYNVVEEMKIAAGLPKMPKVYIIDEAAPNAFATGRHPESASVAVTAGLLELCDRDELQGVIAHELGHVRHYDILFMMMMGAMLGAIVILADFGVRMTYHGGASRHRRTSNRDSQGHALILLLALVLMILAPLLAQLMYYAASRKRELLADASAVQLTRYPEGLARALEKLAANTTPLPVANKVTAPMYIVNPLNVTERGLSDLTRTHPPISERVRILRSMAGGAGLQAYDAAFRKVTGRPVGVIPHQALSEAEAIPLAGPTEPSPSSHQERVRETTDALWRLNRYAFIPCPCGATLKIPPDYRGQSIHCPHCGQTHPVDA